MVLINLDLHYITLFLTVKVLGSFCELLGWNHPSNLATLIPRCVVCFEVM